ncbi:ribonuclease M5 [Bacillus sp. FSL W7-1360]
MHIKEVIVVEGRSDTVAIKRAVQADTIETGGTGLGEMVLKQIELAHKRRGVIILTDPDYPGTQIRRIVSERVPGCKHAFIAKEDAIKPGRNVGVEYASPEVIRSALNQVRKEEQMIEVEAEVTLADLVSAGLVSGERAKWRREKLGQFLSIGYANGKQLLKRLHLFRISRKEFLHAVQAVQLQEEKHVE